MSSTIGKKTTSNPAPGSNCESEKPMAREALKKVKVRGPKGKTGFCILYNDGTIRIDWVRFSYPHLKKPYKGDNDEGEAKYGVVGLMLKKGNDAALDLLEDRIDALLKENKIKALADDKKFLRDGDKSDKEENEGSWIISARETRKPPLRLRDNSRVEEPEDIDEFFRGGFWGSILIRPWFQKNKFGKRVNAGISSVQFLMKDEEFGEGRISDEDLDDTFDDHGEADDYDDDGDDEAPRSRRKRSRDDDEDEDERPKRRRASRDDDDDEPAPRRRRSRDDDDDEPAPRRRRRPADDEDDDI